MPVYIADRQGFFAANGLAPKFVTTGNDDKTFAALVSGGAAFGISDPTFAYLIVKASGTYDVPLVLAGVTCIVVLAAFLNGAVIVLERYRRHIIGLVSVPAGLR